MDIKILDSWLRDYLITDAKPEAIAKYLSLCGPSIERIEPARISYAKGVAGGKFGDDFVYDIEITTNRIDEVGVYGIAREASAILPRFGIKASLKLIKTSEKEFNFVKNVGYLKTVIDSKLCSRFTAVLIKNVKISESSNLIKKRLESAGVRSLNNVVDISNYIMLELGQPVHTFDYDKIKKSMMILRESKKGEKIVTLDEKEFTLPGGDIVIEDGGGRIIDLCGIMGGKLSAIDEYTKNVLLFVQTYDGGHIRKTSMAVAQRTMAATIFEKGTDAELVKPAILQAINLFKKMTGGIPVKEILDIYPNPYKTKTVNLDYKFIEERLGVTISKKEIANYLNALEFSTIWKGDTLSVSVPSFRAKDVDIPEDILEEIARIYGYHNLPSRVMNGEIPARPANPQFAFETKLREMFTGWGGTEVYTLSLVPKEYVDEKSLKLKNPLGTDYEYLRTSLMPSLVSAATGNLGTTDEFHLFEMANVYLPQTNDLPEEKMMLAGVFSGYGYNYREAKGVVEALLEKLHISAAFEAQDSKGFEASKIAIILSGKEIIGKIGYAENTNLIYYELEVEKLLKLAPNVIQFREISKYPAQQEDITIILPERTMIGEVAKLIISTPQVRGCSVGNPYNGNNYTFHIWYQDPNKTLTDIEVEQVRNKVLQKVKEKFGGSIKN